MKSSSSVRFTLALAVASVAEAYRKIPEKLHDCIEEVNKPGGHILGAGFEEHGQNVRQPVIVQLKVPAETVPAGWAQLPETLQSSVIEAKLNVPVADQFGEQIQVMMDGLGASMKEAMDRQGRMFEQVAKTNADALIAIVEKLAKGR